MIALKQLTHIGPLAVGSLPESFVLNGAAGPMRLTGHWDEFLWDLACLDPVWIETAASGAVLSQTIELQGIRIKGEMGLAEGPGFGLYCFLDEWHAMLPQMSEASPEPTGFDIEARDRSILLSLAPDERAHRFALRMLMRTYQVRHHGVVPFRHHGDSAFRLAKRLQNLVRWQETTRPLDTGDIAEACGWLSLNPARMQSRGRARPVEPELISCFLETLADQTLAVRVLAGTSGVAQCFQGSFHAYRVLEDDWIQLLAEQACLQLEPAAIDSAWVLERPGPDGARHQLRLYDEHGRALVFIEDLHIWSERESPIWRTLVKALMD